MAASGHVKLVYRKRGPVFYAKYRLADGRQTHKLIGPAHLERSKPPAGHFTRSMAEHELQRLLAHAGATPKASSVLTFGDACREWLRYVEHEKQRAWSTVRDYRNVVKGDLLPEFGVSTPLAAVTSEAIEEFRDRMLEEGRLSRRTVQKVMVLVHGVMQRAVAKRWIATNPAAAVERVNVERSGDFNVLTPIEVAAVARAAATAQDAVLITVAAYTGLRMGELRALRWVDVDFANRNLHVRRNRPHGGDERAPKSGRVRSVPLIDEAARALDELSRRDVLTDPGDYVFLSPTGGPLQDGAGRAAFYGALKAAGLDHLRTKDDPIVFHDLRHTFGTLAVQAWPLTDVQAYMGHANIETTMIYVHHVPKHDAADRLSALVAAALAPAESVPPTVSRTTT